MEATQGSYFCFRIESAGSTGLVHRIRVLDGRKIGVRCVREVVMTEQQFKLEVPAQIKEVAEKTIDQAERGFSAFIEAANKSVSMIPNPTTDMSLRALSLTDQNMKAAFDHAKKLLQAKDLQEAMRLQAEFLTAQYKAATEQLREMGNNVRSSGAEVVKKSVEIK
jgi:phasin